MSIGFARRLQLGKLFSQHALRSTRHESVHGDVPFVPPAVSLNADALGTPGEVQRSRASRRERRWRVAFLAGLAVVIFCAGAMAGNSNSTGKPTLKERIEILQDIPARQAVMLLPNSKRRCAYDFTERCTVCIHQSDLGALIKTSMC